VRRTEKVVNVKVMEQAYIFDGVVSLVAVRNLPAV